MRGLLLGLLGLFILGCGGASAPDWTTAGVASSGGKIYGVGSSPIHVKGLTYQRALAVSRAIDEIARQKGVTVNNTLQRVESVNASGGVSSASNSYSVQTVEGNSVNAKIEQVYQDPRSKKIFVLMVEN